MLAAVAAGALGWTASAGAASRLEVLAVVPHQDTVSAVVAVQPPPSLRPAFRVDGRTGADLEAEARPVVSAQLATGLVLDTSAAGADMLQGGINGATSFLLQLPDEAGNVVVADGGTGPALLAPLGQGAINAVGRLSAARAGGERHPGAAVAAALAALPARSGQPRLLLLYTGAPDAGGRPAAELSETLRSAGVLLAVVATADDQAYWSQLAEATGGVLVSARGPATLTAFDRVAQLLRERFVLTFRLPAELPATVRISVQVGSETAGESAVVPAPVGAPAPEGSGSSLSALWWVLAGSAAVAAAVVGLLLVARRRRAAPAPEAGRAGGSGPRPDGERPATGTIPDRPLPRRVQGGPPPGAEPAPLPRRRPGASGSQWGPALTWDAAPDTSGGTRRDSAGPAGMQEPPPSGGAAVGSAPTGGAPTGGPPRAGTGGGTGPQPAADERAYGRLDAEIGRVASLVGAGRMDFRRAVAQIAMAAPGRVDLLDRVIEADRRLAGTGLDPSSATATELELLGAARKVVTGEVALVAPTGIRVEHTQSVLRVTGPGRYTRECRTTTELARHVDLSTLSVDA